MGMDPKNHMWVGLKIPDDQLPPAISKKLKNEDEITVTCVRIQKFYDGSECVGIGAEFLYQDLDNAILELELTDLAAKAAALKVSVTKIFASWGIYDEPRIFLLLDYS